MKLPNKTKEFLVQKYYDVWREENKEMLEEGEELIEAVVLFNARWGTDISLTYGKIDTKPQK